MMTDCILIGKKFLCHKIYNQLWINCRLWAPWQHLWNPWSWLVVKKMATFEAIWGGGGTPPPKKKKKKKKKKKLMPKPSYQHPIFLLAAIDCKVPIDVKFRVPAVPNSLSNSYILIINTNIFIHMDTILNLYIDFLVCFLVVYWLQQSWCDCVTTMYT